MYKRNWTSQSWWHSVKMFKKLELYDIDSYQVFHMFPPQQMKGGLTSLKSFNNDSDKIMIMNLLRKYPELKYIPHGKEDEPQEITELKTNFILTFVRKQKEFIKKGFTREKAFEMAEKLYQDRMERKRIDNNLTRNIAMNNRGRSFISYYQQQAEYESRLKVLRLERDLSKFEKAKKEFKKNVMENDNYPQYSKENEGPKEEFSSDKEFLEELIQELNEESYPKPYKKTLEKIVSKGESEILEENKDSLALKQQKVDEFVLNTKNMFSLYYDRAAMKDKLSGLTDMQIRESLKDSPKRFKSRTKLLRKKLIKYNIKLDKNGEIDFSESTAPPNVQKTLQNNPMVKMSLLSQDLKFEFEHLEKSAEEARILNQKLEKLEKTKDDEEYMEKFYVREGEINKYKKKIDVSDFKTYEKIHDEKDEVQSETVQEYQKKINSDDLNSNPDFYKMEATYRLIETFPERLKRLEKKWLQKKLNEINGVVSENKSRVIAFEKLKEVIEDFRRLKFQLEQHAYNEAQELLFEEHNIFEKKELLADKEIPYEKLESHLRKMIFEKKLTQKEETDELLILKMISRKEIDEDSVKPFDVNEEIKFQNTEKYSEVNAEKERIKALEKALQIESIVKNRSNKMNNQVVENEGEMELIAKTETEEQEKEADIKTERKKLVEFIEKTNEERNKKVKTRAKKTKKHENLDDSINRLFEMNEAEIQANKALREKREAELKEKEEKKTK